MDSVDVRYYVNPRMEVEMEAASELTANKTIELTDWHCNKLSEEASASFKLTQPESFLAKEMSGLEEEEAAAVAGESSAWSRYKDESSNQFYLVHSVTGETKWERLSRKTTYMPDGWARGFTDMGEKYYIAPGGQETQWERPPGND